MPAVLAEQIVPGDTIRFKARFIPAHRQPGQPQEQRRVVPGGEVVPDLREKTIEACVTEVCPCPDGLALHTVAKVTAVRRPEERIELVRPAHLSLVPRS